MSVKYYTNNELADISGMLIKTTGSEYYQEIDCTAAEYAAISPHNPHTIYVVTQPDETIVKYLGDEEIGYDKYYTIQRAAVVKEEDAETMIVEHETINVDVMSGTTAIYGNANNKFIADGKRVMIASSNAQMISLFTREDLYGAGVSYLLPQSVTRIINSITITSIGISGSKKQYNFTVDLSSTSWSPSLQIPSDKSLVAFGMIYKSSGVNQTNHCCNGVLTIGAIDNEGNKYLVDPPGLSAFNFSIQMSDAELNFALGMTERYEVIES